MISRTSVYISKFPNAIYHTHTHFTCSMYERHKVPGSFVWRYFSFVKTPRKFELVTKTTTIK